MECYYHPDKKGVNTCAICGKSVCEECSLEIAGRMYCKECLEKIVGIGLDNKTNTPQEETEPAKQEPIVQNEPVRLDKKVDNDIYQPPQEEETPSESYYQAPQEEVQANNTEKFVENVAKKPISDDSPYNIREMRQDNEIEQPKTFFKKEATDYLEQQPTNINQEPEYYEAPKQMQQPPSAQNEFDYYPQEQIAPQQEPTQEYIYPDHEYNPGKTSARQALEDKYEKYLDDLYFDEENEIPLEQQLAKDEEEYGSLTKKPYTPQEPTLENEQQINSFEQPQEPYKQNEYAQNTYQQQSDNNYAPQQNYSQNPYGQQMNNPYAQQNTNQYYPQEEMVAPQGQHIPYPEKQARLREQKRQEDKKGIHDIKYEEEKEPIGIVDIILTIILIIAILIVIFYIVYLFFLSSQYPTFIDAIFGIMG